MMTPDRNISPDVMNLNLTPYMRELQPLDVTFTVAKRVIEVKRNGNELEARISSDYLEAIDETRSFDQIIVNHGTTPLADIYFELLPHSSKPR